MQDVKDFEESLEKHKERSNSKEGPRIKDGASEGDGAVEEEGREVKSCGCGMDSYSQKNLGCCVTAECSTTGSMVDDVAVLPPPPSSTTSDIPVASSTTIPIPGKADSKRKRTRVELVCGADDQDEFQTPINFRVHEYGSSPSVAPDNGGTSKESLDISDSPTGERIVMRPPQRATPVQMYSGRARTEDGN